MVISGSNTSVITVQSNTLVGMCAVPITYVFTCHPLHTQPMPMELQLIGGARFVVKEADDPHQLTSVDGRYNVMWCNTGGAWLLRSTTSPTPILANPAYEGRVAPTHGWIAKGEFHPGPFAFSQVSDETETVRRNHILYRFDSLSWRHKTLTLCGLYRARNREQCDELVSRMSMGSDPTPSMRKLAARYSIEL